MHGRPKPSVSSSSLVSPYQKLEARRRQVLRFAAMATTMMALVIAPTRFLNAPPSDPAGRIGVLGGWLLFLGASLATLVLVRLGRVEVATRIFLVSILLVIAVFAIFETPAMALIATTLGLAFLLEIAMTLDKLERVRSWALVIGFSYVVSVSLREAIRPSGLVGDGEFWPVVLGPAMAFGCLALLGWLSLKTVMEALAESESRAQTLRELNQRMVDARDAAMQSSRAKSTFLATMSHELRTPLTAVIGYGELIQEETDEAFEYGEEVASIVGSARLLLEIIDDVLDLSKVEAGTLEVRLEVIELRVFLEEFVRGIRAQVIDKGLAFSLEVRGDLSPLADPMRLRQVLLGLLSNAIKFTSRGGITISAERVDEGGERPQVCISVRDTGIGISSQDARRIFTPFSQADDHASRIHGGTGLGLTIGRRLAELMGGTLTVESEFGVGSTFEIRLRENDAAKPQPELPEPPEPPEPPESLEPAEP